MRTDRVWKSGITAGLLGFLITVLNYIILSAFFRNVAGPFEMSLLVLLAMNVMAYIAAGILAGITATQYASSETESLMSGLIAGCIASYIPVSILILFVAKALFALLTQSAVSWTAVLEGIILLVTLVVQVVLSGLISFGYTGYFGRKKMEGAAAPSAGEDGELIELKATYDDLWKDARTLAADLNSGIQLYLLVGFFAFIYGLVIAAYALVSWQRIFAGSTGLADALAAIGETVGSAILLVAGPLLIRWYFKLKTRYSRLIRIEQGAGE